MNYDDFLKNKLIKKVEPDFAQIKHQLKRAVQDMETARANLKIDPTWALTIAYHSMVRAGRALMYSEGYLPTINQSHKTIVEFTKLFLGDKYHGLLAKFNRLRRKRHNFIYDSANHVNPQEALSALETAEKLIEQIKKKIEK